MTKKAVILLILFFQSLSCNPIFIDESYERDLRVIRSLDIEDSFLLDEKSLFMKKRIDKGSKYFFRSLKNGGVFVPILSQMLRDEGVPEVFLYMAMAESNFTLNARSYASADGLWQFMSATARQFGLKINYYIDERRDPIKSTEAAIRYLKYLHNRFGKWYLVALAYNCGEGRISKSIKRAGTDELSILASPELKYIPKETRTYIRRIISLSQMAQNHDFLTQNSMDYLLNRGRTKTLKKIYLNSNTTLRDMAFSLKMDVEKLKIYNRHIKLYATPPGNKKYHIYVPYQSYNRVNYNYSESRLDSGVIIHTVSTGDSLREIARKYGVSYDKIIDFNDLKDTSLSINQRLIIPIDRKNEPSLDIKEDIKKKSPTLRDFIKNKNS